MTDTSTAVDFLEKLRPGGPWVLTAISPNDAGIQTITAANSSAVAAFVRANNGRRNLYYSVNPTRTAMTSKAKKEDIAAIEYFLADLDPKDDETPEAAKARYLAVLETHQPTCTAVVDSGNGIQVLWKLAEPIPLVGDATAIVTDVEARVKALILTMGSVAGTQNIDRVLRLPGTTNLPNAKKLRDGRVPCPATLIRFNGATCSVDDFPAATGADGGAGAGADAQEPSTAETSEHALDWDAVAAHAGWLRTVADLPVDFNAKGRIVVGHSGTIRDLNADLQQAGLVIAKPYQSWSEVILALTAILKADGRYTLEQIAAALLCDLECNQHITKLRDQTKRRRAIERLLNRSHEPPAQRAFVRALNWRECRLNGSPIASLHNVRLGIQAMGIACRHDLFRDITIIGFTGDKIVHEVKPLIGELTNSILLMLRLKFSEKFGFDPEDKFIFDAVKTLAFENCFDPVLDMLAKAEADYDGVGRLDNWGVTYLKCENTPLNRAIGRKALIAAVRRARVPGCKFDNIITLEGEEGINKSSAILTLAGEQFFSDQSVIGARDKEVQEQLTGVWMHETADLTGLKRAEVEHVKAFASRTTDRARPAYGRVLEKKPRRSLLWATTNDEEYLQSQTGNRRFWPLAVGRIDIEALRCDRLQLLGEAAKYETACESIVLDEALWKEAGNAQEQRRIKHPWEDIVANLPASLRVFDPSMSGMDTKKIIYIEDGKECVASADVLTYVLGIPVGQQGHHHTMRLATVMKRAGWQRDKNKITINGKQVRGYRREVAPAAAPTEPGPTVDDEPF